MFGIPLLIRCGIGGIVGGVLILLSPDMKMFWQGLVAIAIGLFSIFFHFYGHRAIGRQRDRVAPTFEVDEAEAEALTPNTLRLVQGVRRERDQQPRAE